MNREKNAECGGRGWCAPQGAGGPVVSAPLQAPSSPCTGSARIVMEFGCSRRPGAKAGAPGRDGGWLPWSPPASGFLGWGPSHFTSPWESLGTPGASEDALGKSQLAKQMPNPSTAMCKTV